MRPGSAHRLGSAAALCILLAGAFIPATALSQTTSAQNSQGQLQTMIGLAEASRSYAQSVVEYASSNGLDVPDARALINAGDSFLATAKGDATSGADLQAGITAAQSAMREYTYASANATVTFNSGLLASAEADSNSSAIAEVNFTASAVAYASQQAYLSASAGERGSATFSQAYGNVSSGVQNARAYLSQAAALVEGFRAGSLTTSSLSQAKSLVGEARAQLVAAGSALASLAALAYPDRLKAFLAPALLAANSSVTSQASLLSNITLLESGLDSYAQAQASAASSIESSAAGLETVIASVDLGSAATAISAARHVTTLVQGNLTELASLVSSLPGSASLNTSIYAAQSAAASYSHDAALTSTASASFEGTVLVDFPAYAASIGANGSNLLSSSQEYVSSYGFAVGNLTAFVGSGLVPPLIGAQLLSLQTNLNSLYSSTVTLTDNVNYYVQSEVQTMDSVTTALYSLFQHVGSSSSQIEVSQASIAALASVYGEEKAYLNYTGLASLSVAVSFVDQTNKSAVAYIAAAEAAFQATIGAFGGDVSSLSILGIQLRSQIHLALGALASAAAYVKADSDARAASLSSALGEISAALASFEGLDVAAGAAASVQAYIDLRLASETYVSAP
jgi:hypothetical protein